MLKTKSFLCIDFGAGSLKIAEFEPTEAGALRLKQFGVRPLGFEGSQDVARERVILKAIQELMAERSFTARSINACAPGFHVFSKFVKLPPVDASKVSQIIQYEAKQNVPFPLEEVAWDFQILGTTASGELEVLLEGGRHLTYKTGDAIIEVVGTMHNGINKGSEAARLVVFYTGSKGQPNVIRKQE